MIEIIILYILAKEQNTMYGLYKLMDKWFGTLTSPSLGTVQPALKRLEKNKFITANKFISEGGKPYYYYSVTEDGKEELNNLLLNDNVINSSQIFVSARIKLICADILNQDVKTNLYKSLKSSILKIQAKAESNLKNDVFSKNFYGRIVLDNNICEAKNLLDLIERLEKCPQ